MNITFLDFDDIKNPLLGAGQAHATMEVGKRLVEKGHRVTVFCSRYPGSKDRVESGIEYRHIGLGTGWLKLNNLAFLVAAPLAVQTIRADLIIECFTAPISTLFSPLFTTIPVIGLPSMFNAAEFTKKYKLPFHWIERIGMKFYRYLLPYSQIDSAKAKRLNPLIHTEIIPQGVGEEFFKFPRKEPKHILYFGRLDIAQKGIDLLLAAYAKVKGRISYPLVIAGHGPDQTCIEKLIRKQHLEDRVSLIGPTYGNKKEDVFSEALFVAFPSRHDEMCLSTLEVLAAGLPIVGFDIPESSWISHTVSLKASAFDVDKYADMLLAATNPATIALLAANTRSFAAQFSWESVAGKFERYAQFVLDREATRPVHATFTQEIPTA